MDFYVSDVYGAMEKNCPRVVYTAGTFDILHKGHIRLLEQCRQIAGRDGLVCVGLNSDAFVTKYRNRPPIMTQDERFAVLAAMRNVNAVIFNDDPQWDYMKQAFLIGLKIDNLGLPPSPARFLVIGSDWAAKDYYKQIDVTQAQLDRHRIALCYVPYTEGISSTDIRWRVRQ